MAGGTAVRGSSLRKVEDFCFRGLVVNVVAPILMT